MTRITTLLGIVLTALVTSAGLAFAQGPVIRSPQANQQFAAGPDYASDVLQDPWDFNNVADVGQYPYEYLGWTQSASAFEIGPAAFGVGSGKFTATSSTGDPAIGLLYPGGVGIPNPGRSGQRYPIDTSRYRKLAFRMRTTGGTTQAQIHWYSSGVGGPTQPSTALTPGSVSDGERIYQVDLVANHRSGPIWQGNMLGLRLDPFDNSGAQVELDWVRLTAPDAPSNTMTIAADNCSGTVNVEVQEASSGPWMSVATSRTFNYGILPPGNHNLRITCSGSGQSAPVPFVINDPPQVTVVQPDERGGTDYATAVRGNPWDMDDLGDVLGPSNIEPVPGQPVLAPSPDGGLMLRARNVAGPNTSITGDPSFFLLNGEAGGRPIASRRFRHLTFTMQLHRAFDLDANLGGSLLRVGWASAMSFDGYTAAGTRDILIWPGRNTYTIDLGALGQGTGLEPCGNPPAPAPPNPCYSWAQASPRFFRFDPHEFGHHQVAFDVDNITLSAPDEVVQGQTFRLQWSVAGASAGNVRLFYDTDRNPGGEQLIATRPIGDTAYDWNVGGLAPGDYYIYVEANEPVANGTQTRGAYSTGVLHVISAANHPVVTIASHAPGSTAYAPFTLSGCAYNGAGTPSGEVVVYAHPLQGQLGGGVQVLGYNAPGGLGTIAPASCGSGPGYAVSNVNLAAGLWTFRVLARNPVTGDFDEVQAQNVTVSGTSAPPTNLRVAAVSGNTVTLAWDAPPTAVTHYLVQGAASADFAGLVQLSVPASPTSLTITLGDGTYYVRVRAMNQVAIEGPPSKVISFTLPGGGPVQPPGAITLGGRLNANPILLNWSQAGGGPATYTLIASGQRGGADIVVPLGAATSFPPIAVPLGVTYYVRVVATNSAGSTVSNEVTVQVPLPGPPGGPPIQLDPIISDNTVTLRWNPPADGAVPTGYYIGVRVPGSDAIQLVLPVSGTSLTVPGVPTGTFTTSMAAIYGSQLSGESNRKTFSVQ